MRLLLFVQAATAAALALAPQPAPAENFFNSCDEKTVKVTGKILQASCKNIVGAFKCSKLDLNKCIKNNYGSLQADPAGSGPHFGDQCINCSNQRTDSGFVIAGGPTLIHCQCNPGTQIAQSAWPTAFIDINEIVDNNNGILECFKTKGTPC